MNYKNNPQEVSDLVNELVELFDKYIVCLVFATLGLEERGKKLAKSEEKRDSKLWIASNIESNPKYHANIKIVDCIDMCKKDGFFSNEIAKSLLCTLYSLWDESYRHKFAKIADCEAKYIRCSLMGDLRKIRNCIVHEKSVIPKNGLTFEVLDWKFNPLEKLIITKEMFISFNDLVRGKGMKIQRVGLHYELDNLVKFMTTEEQESFDNFIKKEKNNLDNTEWPDQQKFLDRIRNEQQ